MADYQAFVTNVHRLLDIDLSLYKEAQMKRRLTSLRNKRGFNNFDTYFKSLQTEKELREEFIDRMTINVSEFYRNPRRWDVLREKIFPKLIKNNSRKKLRIWSAACSTGEEPYSLAMMLHEHFNGLDYSILATDIDEKVLNRARNGIYKAQSLKGLPIQKKSTYFTSKNESFYIDDALKRNITFKKHNLLKDRYPLNIDLIVCRNVLIYFTNDAKEYIYTNLGKSLSSNGILFVGSTEQIFNPNQYNMKLFDTFFYEKN